MENNFATRPENIFVDYHGIIKDSVPLILNQLPKHFKSNLKDFIDFSKFENLDMDNLTRVSVQRTKKNILEYFAIKEFDYDKLLNDISNQFPDLYMNCERLTMADTLSGIISNQKFLNKIYVHTTEYDKRVHYDIHSIFGKNSKKVHYVTGDKKDVYNDLEKLTSFIINDVEDINILLELNKLQYTDIIISGYGYNYTLNKENKPVLKIDISEKVIHDNLFKYGTFVPHKLSLKHFSQMEGKI